jgi:sensor domain CHASE-containing protein
MPHRQAAATQQNSRQLSSTDLLPCKIAVLLSVILNLIEWLLSQSAYKNVIKQLVIDQLATFKRWSTSLKSHESAPLKAT